MSASKSPQVGPAMICASSITLIPCSGPFTSLALEFRFGLGEESFVADLEVLGVEAGEALVVFLVAQRQRAAQPPGEFLVPARNQRRAVGNGVTEVKKGDRVAYAMLQENDKSVADSRRAVELKPISKDAVDGAIMLCYLALIYARVGEIDQAIPLIEQLLKTAGVRESGERPGPLEEGFTSDEAGVIGA